MSLFNTRATTDGTYNPFERPSMPLSALGLDGILNPKGAGRRVTVEEGLAIPTAYRCLAIISTVMASLVLEQIGDDGDAVRWLGFDDLMTSTPFETFEMIAARIGGWGDYFGLKVGTKPGGGWKGPGDKLLDLQPYPGGDVRVVRKKGAKTYLVKRRDPDTGLVLSRPSPEGEGPGMTMYDEFPAGPDCPIFHIPGFGFDGLQGIGPVMLAAQTFGTALSADELAARFYSQGQQLGGIIKVKAPLTGQEQADKLKYRWQSRNSGLQGAGGVAVLDAETEFQPLTIAPEALQFLGARQWQATEVARMFGVPPHLVGELEKSTSWGSGIEEQNQGFVTFTIRSYTDRTEQRITREFGDIRKPFEFDLDRMLRGSMTERFQAYGQGIGWGWLTRNEARKKERMKKLPGLDEPLTPQAMNGALSDPAMAAGGAKKPAGVQNALPQGEEPNDD